MFSSPDFENQLHQQRLLSRPEVHKMSKLDEMISETLARTDISDSEKYDLYNGILADFRKVHHDVLRMGSMMTPSPNFFPENSKHVSDQTNGDDMINAVAEILKKLQENGPAIKTESTSSASNVQQKNIKKKAHKVVESFADKLAYELKRDGRFKKDLEDSVFLDKKSGIFNEQLWKKTLGFLTRKNVSLKNVPTDIMEKAHSVYDFMISNKLDPTPWMNQFPLFQHVSSQHSKGKRIVKKKGKGVLPKVAVDWDAWDIDLKKVKK